MRILLTNDDGIESQGLQLLLKKLNTEHEVWVVAPEYEMSGSSHSISIKTPIRVKKRGSKKFTLKGTPADCVILGLKCLIPGEIDLIISGINHGPNLGTDILYSGTVAAARQGALNGKPSIALSLANNDGHYHFNGPLEFIKKNLKIIYDNWSEGHFLNINFPRHCTAPFETAITFPSRRIYRDNFTTFNAPDGNMYYFMHGDDAYSYNEEGSDHYTIMHGKISISPVLIHPANHKIEEKYKITAFWKVDL